ncbi:YjbH domain-containing protein [Spirosoma rhododendri]|uniref:YjbH domain-containing protein n=1 Tax=Spirosoma rhododendri TaxID=2728024 RepID=A0A7L5DQ78_9BACT|nr:YjbH domain-containing protein [Spirosoma rhododendri]QJD79631.1 YjbH domain-containing protein [Spirosoma rhododendri]
MIPDVRLLYSVMTRRLSRVCLLGMLSGVLSGTTVLGQVNISGKPGLLYVPTATLLPDGTFHAGVAYNPVNYAFRFNPALNPKLTTRNSESIFFVNLVMLPRLELNVNLLRPNGPVQYGARGIGDRQIDMKYGVLTETARRPSVAVILSIPFGIDNSLITNAIVATKHVSLSSAIELELTAGYASPYFLERSDTRNDQNSTLFSGFIFQDKRDKAAYYLAGPIAGIKASLSRKGGLMAEWDSQHINLGGYATLFRHWTVQAGVLNFDQLTVGTSYAFSLLPTKQTTSHDKAQ